MLSAVYLVRSPPVKYSPHGPRVYPSCRTSSIVACERPAMATSRADEQHADPSLAPSSLAPASWTDLTRQLHATKAFSGQYGHIVYLISHEPSEGEFVDSGSFWHYWQPEDGRWGTPLSSVFDDSLRSAANHGGSAPRRRLGGGLGGGRGKAGEGEGVGP
jgi:hypothetical protein